MKKKIISFIVFALVFVLMFGLTAFAQETDASLEKGPSYEYDMGEINNNADDSGDALENENPEVEKENSDADEQNLPQDTDETERDSSFDTFPNQDIKNESEAEEEADNNNEPSDEETPNKPNANEDGANAEETGNAPGENVQNNVQEKAESGYFLTVSSADGKSTNIPGGAQTDIADVLRALGNDIDENSVITFDPESVDTDVIGLAVNENGKVVLTDNGPFEKANKTLVVYVDDVPVYLEIVDDTFVSYYVSSAGNDDNPGTEAQPYKTIIRAKSNLGTLIKITLLTDIKENTVIASDEKIIIDLNGHVLKGYGDSSVIIVNGGELTVTDSDPSNENNIDGVSIKGGVITGGKGVFRNVNAGDGCGVYVNGGTFTLEGGTIYGNMFDKYNSGGYGGGVYVVDGSFTMNDGSISGNKAKYGGGVYIKSVGKETQFTMNGGSISGNIVEKGGGVYVYGGTFTMNGGSITENEAYNDPKGGGVYLDNNINDITTGKSFEGHFDMNGGSISGNRAEDGGGVYVFQGIFKMSAGTITKNNASANGGGVFNGGRFKMKAGTISENKAKSGGGVYNELEFIMEGGTITNNEATKGGGVYHQHYWFTMSGGYIEKNNAQDGAGVYNRHNFAMTGGWISENAATNDGGGVYNTYEFTMKAGTTTVGTTTVGTIYNNIAAKYGGGVYNYNVFTMSGGFIDTNKSKNGAGVYNCDKFTMTDGTIKANIASEYGGGVYNVLTFTINTGTITENVAEIDGGGVFNNGTLEMNGGTITYNEAYENGGGVYNCSIFTMKNAESSISNNKAEYGGGVYADNGTFSLTDGCISKNTATRDGGGVCVINGTFSMEGGSISENTAEYGGGVDNSGSFKMTGGTISANKASESGGGVYCFSSITAGGTAKITGNTNASTALSDNVFLSPGEIICIAADNISQNDLQIGVKTACIPTLDNPVAVTGMNAADYKSCFTSDNSDYYISDKVNADKHTVVLFANSDWSYELIGEDTIKAVPKSGGEPQDGTLTIESSDALYDAKEHLAKFKQSTFLGKNPTVNMIITYYLQDTTTKEYKKLNGNPKDAGSYMATFTIGDKTAQTKFVIEEAAAVLESQGKATYYKTVQEAVDNAGSSQSVVTMRIDSKENIIIGDGQTITFDLHGHTLSASGGTVILNNGTLTINDSVGNGRISGGDIGIENNYDLLLTGKATVLDNTKNIYLPNGKVLAFSNDFEGKVGISTEDSPAHGNAIPVTATISSPSKYVNCMKSDNEDYAVFIDDYDADTNRGVFYLGVIERPSGENSSQSNIRYLVDTDDNCSAYVEISGTVAEITFKDKDGNAAEPQNVKILHPEQLIKNGAVTAQIHMGDKFTLALDIKAAMCGKPSCVITIDNIKGIITVSCDNDVIFTFKITDIVDSVRTVVYDGDTVKAYDADGNLLKEI